MKKIAFVVQRYGVEVNGGAEYYCRIMAERLANTYEVDVLTSCALEYVTWANWYPAETVMINGVRVHRFATKHERLVKQAARAEHKLKKWSRPEEWQGLARLRMWARALVGKSLRRYSRLWAEYQGPYTPDLIDYLKRNHQQYDALIFITYLYYPTIAGLNVAPQKSIFIPTAHDEVPIYLPVFGPLFQKPRAILFLTPAERSFVHQLFRNESIRNDVVGVGIEPARALSDKSVSEILNLGEPGSPAAQDGVDYLLYIGRIDTAKGCDTMFEFFRQYKEAHPSPLKLVLVGQAFMPIPDHPDIRPVGFVDEPTKATLLQHAKALVMPSPYESLSMVTLESFAVGIPVIATAECAVLRDHIVGSRAGLLFRSYEEFGQAVDQILTQDSAEMANNGRAYVNQYYTWKNVLATFDEAVKYVAS
ncbi:glycosyltransferase family 4 protein [Spirosoma sordidisoli]|uniref:Glycosyltransferase n=1 Tax=Spirosoma sordidisoli TaxID=2502893 RepID=A0A4Q2UR25_9BACT|nr:glycosyltransferase family 4 protein [Spirosoma sordidisoli]RYC70125.1 glycosyltransferase [Spirosoma sordidisoli]